MTIEQLTDINNIDKLSKMSDEELKKHLEVFFKVTRPEMAEKPSKRSGVQKKVSTHKRQAKARRINNKANEVLQQLRDKGIIT